MWSLLLCSPLPVEVVATPPSRRVATPCTTVMLHTQEWKTTLARSNNLLLPLSSIWIKVSPLAIRNLLPCSVINLLRPINRSVTWYNQVRIRHCHACDTNASFLSVLCFLEDGFGSSQTDVRLQQKYGNVKEQVYISPPPVGVMGAPVAPVPTTPAPTDSVQPGMTRSVSNPDNSAPLPIPTGSSSAHLSSTLNNISISGSGVNSGHHSAPTSNSGQQVSPPTPSLPLPTPSQRSSTTSVSKSPRSTAATSKVDNSSIPVTHDTPKPPVPTVFVPPTPAVSSAPLATTATTTATTTTVHKPSSSFASSSIIKPGVFFAWIKSYIRLSIVSLSFYSLDGFGSSQTDVRLQQKYGNVKEQVFISPPPVGGIGGQPTASVPLMNPYGGKQQSSAPVVSAPPPVFYQQPQNQSQIPQSMPVPHQTGVQSNTPPLPYSSSTGRSQQVMSTSDDGSNFSTIDLDSNSSAMM